jgi:dTMP kinase
MTAPARGSGFFVVVEGPEGAGKSTLAAGLAARWRAAGVEPVVVREPGGTPAAEAARRALLDAAHPVGPVTELFLILAARSDLVASVIRPALAAGRVVVADRFDLSTEAYQIAGRGLDAGLVRSANAAATGGLRPDLILVLDLAPDEGRRRQQAARKVQDRLDRETPEFHRRVAAAYLAARGDRVQHLDGRLAPEQLLEAAWVHVATTAPAALRAVERA